MSTIAKPWIVIRVDSFGEILTSCYRTYEEAAERTNKMVLAVNDCAREGVKNDLSLIDMKEKERDAYIRDPDGYDPDWVVWRIVNIKEEQ